MNFDLGPNIHNKDHSLGIRGSLSLRILLNTLIYHIPTL